MARKIVYAICAFCAIGSFAACNRDNVHSVEMQNSCVQFHARKMFPQAIRDCNKAVSLDPSNVQAQHALAMIYFETKEFAQAARHLQKAIALDPNTAVYHYQLGEAYEWMEQYAQAEPELKRAIELDDTLYKAHYHLGRVYEKLDRPEEAMQKYTDALMKNGKFMDAYRDLGLLYISYSFLAQADQVFREGIKALDGRPDEVGEMYQWLGQVLIEKKEYEAAIQELKKGLELKPDMVDAMFNLGWAYSFTNKENAKIWLEKFIASANQKTRPDYVSAAGARLAELQEGAVIQ
jgi:tetratricopeptide (TPR) repeat protein